mgnify:CR=1 FL=1
MATSKITKEIFYMDISDTTTADGAVNINTKVSGYNVLSAVAIGENNYWLAIPLYKNCWWVMFYNWPALTKVASTSVSCRVALTKA